MPSFVLSKPGEILESVYDLELGEDTWIRRITERMDPFIDGGQGILGCVFRMGRQIEVPVISPVDADDEVPAFIQYMRATEQASMGKGLDVERFGRLFAKSGMGTLSVNRKGVPAYDIFRREFDGSGIKDAAGLVVPHAASRSFLFFTARQRELCGVPQSARARWSHLQNHIAALYDVRYRLQRDEFDETDAVWFETNGTCAEQGPAVHSDVRHRLRDAVQQHERVRAGDTSSRRADLSDYWSKILSGKWTILDRYDTDGRRFVIAMPVTSAGDTLRGLSPRERQVLDHLGDGLANKAIAWELGISETGVSTHLGNIFRKLGIHDRSALVQLVQLLRRRGEPGPK